MFYIKKKEVAKNAVVEMELETIHSSVLLPTTGLHRGNLARGFQQCDRHVPCAAVHRENEGGLLQTEVECYAKTNLAKCHHVGKRLKMLSNLRPLSSLPTHLQKALKQLTIPSLSTVGHHLCKIYTWHNTASDTRHSILEGCIRTALKFNC